MMDHKEQYPADEQDMFNKFFSVRSGKSRRGSRERIPPRRETGQDRSAAPCGSHENLPVTLRDRMTGSRYCSLPECAALRVPSKKPWFAVIGRVPKAKFGMDEGGVVEVINLKDEPKIVSDRVDGKNAFPAYHMNKQHWYTLFLDGRLSDDEIVGLIEKSYALVNQ